MPKAQAAFVVDRKGFARKFASRPKGFVLFELLQNAWDEPITRVDVTAEMLPGRPVCCVVVEDDAPEGFADLASVYTLFRDSKKANDPTKRGRFELGEKLVLALAQRATVTSTKGTVRFEGDTRTFSKVRREAGTRFEAEFKFTRGEFERMCAAISTLLAPVGVVTTFNGRALAPRKPIENFYTALQTVVADDDGNLVKRDRVTDVEVYDVLPGETAHIYEMGIPVVETGDRWHVNVMQKVPVNWERNNVPPFYLQTLRVHVLNAFHDKLSMEDAAQPWVTNALEDFRVEGPAVRTVLKDRFGAKAVIFDPSDPEANKIAMSEGYTVIPGGALPGQAWSNVKVHEACKPAGQVTPSPKPYDPNGRPEHVIPHAEWTANMRRRADFAAGLFQRITDDVCRVEIVREPSASWVANFGSALGSERLCLNFGRLGARWFALPNRAVEVLDLLIHEFVHHEVSDHLSAEMHKTATLYGAKLAQLCLDEPAFFA
jgi:hypothetical protein